jgi:hypothetical protein
LLNRSKKGMVEKAEELLRFLGMEGLIPWNMEKFEDYYSFFVLLM